ncbi:hypothetical protein A9W94_00655 [Mycobacterium asiaticum]|nr:hypothetical protein A9W94_00655 [Mycobacterium asiaticum]
MYQLPAPWDEAILGWLGHLKLQGQSPATIKLRRDHIRSIARRSGAGSPGDITTVQLRALCTSPSWSIDHLSAMRASLCRFYRFCAEEGIVASDPTASWPPVRQSSPAPRPVTDDVWAALLAAAGPRERLMARLAGEAGLRRAEVAKVHRDDLMSDGQGWALLVRGKGGKQRTVPIGASLADAIRSACAELARDEQWNGHLFPGRVDGHISVVYVGQLISKLMPPGWSMHKLRHRYATRGYAGTRNLRAVQQALGHASVATTERYTAVTGSEVRQVSEAAAWNPTTEDSSL